MDGTSEDRLLADGQGDNAPAPAQDSPASARRPKRRVRHHVVLVSIWMFAALAVLALAAGFTILALTGKPVALPDWAVNEAEQRLNARIPVPEMLLSLGKPGEQSGSAAAKHKLSDMNWFYDCTKSDKIVNPPRPYKASSYILISAGYDGEYGTADDVYNFDWKAPQ